MNRITIIAISLTFLISSRSFSADLTKFVDGDVISASAVNGNFQALNDEVSGSPNKIIIGSQAIVTGGFSTSGSGSETVFFPVVFASPPTVTHSIVTSSADDTWIEGQSVSATSFSIDYRGVNYTDNGDGSVSEVPAPITINYIAIGTLSSQ